MKKIYSLIAVALMVVFATVSCNKDNEGEKYRETSSTNFSLTGSTSCSYGLSVDEGEADVNVDDVVITRAIATDAVTLQLQVSKDPKSSASVTVDNLVFNEGETQKSPVVHLRGLGEGQSCTTTFTIPESDAVIAGKSYSFTVTFKRDVRASWQRVTTKSVFQNGIFGMFGSLDPHGDAAPYLTYTVSVEKRSDANIFRIQNITKSSVCPYFEGCDLDGDMYFDIDASNSKFVTVKNVGLKVCLSDAYGEVWAGTDCSAFAAQYNVGGTFDAGTGIVKWDPGMLFTWMPAYGAMEDGSFWDSYETILWLDENNMGDDFNRDYTFIEYLPATYQICEAFSFTYDGAPIYIGDPNDPTKKAALEEKYGTVYAIPDYAVNDYDIYFNINKKGKLALPASYKVQDFGMEIMAGVEVYMAMKNADISEAGGANINYDVVSKDGAVLGSNYTDHFYLFDDEATIDDYVGTYTCDAADGASIQIAKVSDTDLLATGLIKYGPLSFRMATEDQTQISVPTTAGIKYPSFLGGIINEAANIYAYLGNSATSSFYSKDYNCLMFKRLGNGTLLPSITPMGQYNEISEILVLQQTAQGWALGGAYVFTDFVLTPATPNSVAKVLPNKEHKLNDYKGEAKKGLSFNGQPVKAKSKANRKAQLEWIKK